MGEDLPLLALKGNSKDTVNTVAIVIIVGVIGCTLLGYCLDEKWIRKAFPGPKESRPRGWVLGMLISSYLLLLPGLLMTLFSYKIAAGNGFMEMSSKTDNTLEFSRELWESGSHSGFVFVVGFAMVIPVVKLVLLAMGGIYRHSDNEDEVERARKSISFVQKISKWASPDMFAYILFLNLIRGLDSPPTLNGLMELDIGFTCFSTFCVASTISSLGVRSPPDRATPAPMNKFTRKVKIMVGTSVVLTIAFVVLLTIGLTKPCMALRLVMDKLFESGQLSMSMKPIIEMLHVEEKAASDVSLLSCMGNLWGWIITTDEDGIHSYEVNALVGWVMLAVFVLAFTILDVLALLFLAVSVWQQAHKGGQRPWFASELVHVFRKLSMLDVCVMGVVIIVTAGQIYAEMGVVLTLREGLLYLFLAELAHYGLYYIVTSTAAGLALGSEQESESGSSDDTSGDSDDDEE